MDRTLSHHSSQENGFGVFVPQRRPLYKEVVGYRIQDLPSERQRLDTANTLSVNYQDFLYSQNSKEESCYTQGNAGPRAVTQHLKTQTGGAGTHPWKEVILYICYKTVCHVTKTGSKAILARFMCTPCHHRTPRTCSAAASVLTQ